MNFEHVPLTVAGVRLTPDAMLPVALVVIVLVMLMFGIRREIAAFAIAAGVIGTLMMN